MTVLKVKPKRCKAHINVEGSRDALRVPEVQEFARAFRCRLYNLLCWGRKNP